jgi:hypothetical protein
VGELVGCLLVWKVLDIQERREVVARSVDLEEVKLLRRDVRVVC